MLDDALSQLFAGPTAEEIADGQSSLFGSATTHLLREVKLEGGLAVIDLRGDVFTGDLPTVGTTYGSGLFLVQVLGTAFQFNSVHAVELRLDGDAVAFCTYLQANPDCNPFTNTDGRYD